MTITAESLSGATHVELRSVTARIVTASERVAFLGRQVGSFKHTLERAVVRALTELCEGGTLGAWDFVSLSNGGGYLQPPPRSYVIQAPNFITARATAELAGIVATLYALAELKHHYRAEGIFTLRFSQLHEFATGHREASRIFTLFDL